MMDERTETTDETIDEARGATDVAGFKIPLASETELGSRVAVA